MTPCDRSPSLSQTVGVDVWLKREHLQHTGSFKARGALHKLLRLPADARARGVVAASSGNHGAGVAWAGRTLGVHVLVFVPEGASAAKTEKIRQLGADVRTHGTDGLDTELYARTYAAERGCEYVSPYNDLDVVAGQGTVGVELRAQMGEIDSVIVTVGGGGLIGGIAAYLKRELPNVHVIGAQPERSPVMAFSMRAGHIVEFPSQPTLSDGTAGGIEQDSVTFDLCRELVDEWILVSEGVIGSAMREFFAHERQVIEGAAAVALGALEQASSRLTGRRTAVILCGGNVSPTTLQTVLPV